MSTNCKHVLLRASVALLTAFALADAAVAAEALSKEDAKALADFGTKAFGIHWNGQMRSAVEKNVQAVSDGTITLTTRKGSRTYIVNNKKLTSSPAQLDYAGKDADLQKIGMRFLQAAGVNRAEISDVRVVHQTTQTALRDPTASGFKLDKPKSGAPTLMVARQIDGIPVISSRTVLNVDRIGNVAFMELSWPDIAPEVVDRAQRLRKIASAQYQAPRVEGASVESVQAVILHSPAVGFYDDATAAIRVTYRSDSQTTGKLGVRYLDEGGKEVAMPRQIDLPREEPVQRKGATP